MLPTGEVDPDSLAITLSAEVVFTENSNYGVTFSIVGLSSDRFMLAYYNGSSTSPDDVLYGPLQVMVGRVTAGEIQLGNDDAQIAMLPSNVAFKISSARVSDKASVIVFGDVDTDYGVTAVMATAEEQHIGGQAVEVAVLGSTFHVTTGRSFTAIQQGVLMDLDVETVGALETGESLTDASNRALVKFVVLYSDASNDSKQTLSSGLVSGVSQRLIYVYALHVLWFFTLFRSQNLVSSDELVPTSWLPAATPTPRSSTRTEVWLCRAEERERDSVLEWARLLLQRTAKLCRTKPLLTFTQREPFATVMIYSSYLFVSWVLLF